MVNIIKPSVLNMVVHRAMKFFEYQNMMNIIKPSVLNIKISKYGEYLKTFCIEYVRQ